MAADNVDAESSIFDVNRIVHIVFRHKWKIIPCVALGFLVALGVRLFVKPDPVYRSQATLIVRYVDDQPSILPSLLPNDSIKETGGVISAAMSIIHSRDIAEDVVTTLKPDELMDEGDSDSSPSLLSSPGAFIKSLLGGGKTTTLTPEAKKERAINMIRSGLSVRNPDEGATIFLSFDHKNYTLPTKILSVYIESYMKKHDAVYRPGPEYRTHLTTLLAEERAEERRLADTARQARMDAGFAGSNQATYNAHVQELLRLELERLSLETNLKNLKNQLGVMEEENSGEEGEEGEGGAISNEDSDRRRRYTQLSQELAALRQARLQSLAQWDPSSRRIKQQFDEPIAKATEEMRQLETEDPSLTALVAGSPASVANPSMGNSLAMSNEASIRYLEQRIEDIDTQIAELRDRIKDYDVNLETIRLATQRLEKQRLLIEQYEAQLTEMEQEAELPAGARSDIRVTQDPSPPLRVPSETSKMALVAFVALAGLGVGAAGFWEFIVNPTFTRGEDVKSMLAAPFLLSIPFVGGASPRRGPRGFGRRFVMDRWNREDEEKETTEGALVTPQVAIWSTEHKLKPYHEALRDRVVMHFEENQLRHKAKLLGITSFGNNGGVSTTAEGLAATLSEIGDGRVLLVDLTDKEQGVHPFFDGRPPTCDLERALDPQIAKSPTDKTAYFKASATGDSTIAQPTNIALRSRWFAEMIPKLKASNYDYIIFDMPPVSSTSPTVRLGGFLDSMIVVLEAEKTKRPLAEEGIRMLNEANVATALILNKVRQYAPSFLVRGM